MPWDSTEIDTLYRLDMTFKNGTDLSDPIAIEVKDPYKNFYLPHCGSSGVTNVFAFNRVVYENVYPFIDVHFYSGISGQ